MTRVDGPWNFLLLLVGPRPTSLMHSARSNNRHPKATQPHMGTFPLFAQPTSCTSLEIRNKNIVFILVIISVKMFHQKCLQVFAYMKCC
jgi:hypothetical protein